MADTSSGRVRDPISLTDMSSRGLLCCAMAASSALWALIFVVL